MTNPAYVLATANNGRFPLPANSVHLIFTSPPYLWKRDYGVAPSYWGGDPDCYHDWTPQRIPIQHKGISVSATCCQCGCWFGCLGLEPTPEQFISNLVSFFEECKRVLHPSGQMFVNIDDSRHPQRRVWLGIPTRLALALEQAGWRWEDQIIWEVPNRMPNGGIKSRFTHTFETVLMLNKDRKAYFDIDANRTPLTAKTLTTFNSTRQVHEGDKGNMTFGVNLAKITPLRVPCVTENGFLGAALRNVWHIAHRPNGSTLHTAAFPPDLVQTAVRAATSMKGVCPHCGYPWVRQTEKIDHGLADRHFRSAPRDGMWNMNGDTAFGSTLSKVVEYRELGWAPSCACPEHEPIRALVLDPFSGTGTTARIAHQLGRRALGFDVSADFLVESVQIYREETAGETAVSPKEGKGMDEFNRLLMQAAYESLVRDRKIKEPTADDLLANMDTMATHYRDVLIGQWAAELLNQRSAASLVAMYDEVLQRSHDLMLHVEEPDDGDQEGMAVFVAWQSATIRWIDKENDGAAPVFEATAAEAAEFLEKAFAYVPVSKNPGQMPLFMSI